ncbi:hypothetical protein T484DRAFT_1816243 [Baffinella frigidus]|nr:hypothetical protein T484DRAFT_1816243 [Cryptophyta sp. CCMP2293]
MGKKMNAKAKQALKEASSKAGSKGAYSPGWTDDSESENEKAAAGGTTPPASLPPPSDNLDEGYDLASRSPSQTLPPSDDPGDLNSSFQYNQDAEGSSPRKTNSAMASRMLALDGIGGPPSPAGAELRATPRVVMPEQEAAGRQEPLTSADLASSALSPQRSFAAYPSSLEVESALVVETNCCVCFTPASKWLHRPGDPRAWIFHLTFHVAWVLLLIFLVAGLISGGLGQAVAFNGVASSGYFSAGTVSGGVLTAGSSLSVGLFSCGFVSIGLFGSVGIFSVGIFSVGIFSIGITSIAHIALGVWAFGNYSFRFRHARSPCALPVDAK